jgi:hypothetical protein
MLYTATYAYKELSSTNLTSNIFQGNNNIGTATLDPLLNTITIILITTENICANYNYPSSVDKFLVNEINANNTCTLSPNVYLFSIFNPFVGPITIQNITNLSFSIYFDSSTNYVTQSFIFDAPKK